MNPFQHQGIWKHPHRAPGPADPPLRAENLSTERLEEHARQLARTDEIAAPRSRGRLLLPRFHDNGRALAAAQQRFADAVEHKQPVPPAAEWLLDNYYIVQEQWRQITQDLSTGYYRELPKLTRGNYAGYPRVYALAIEYIAHNDSRIDAEPLTRYIAAYEAVHPLSIGELWAMPIMLRLGLFENLRRLVDESMTAVAASEEADRWANLLVKLSAQPKADYAAALTGLVRSRLDPLVGVQLLQRLRDQDLSLSPAIRWLSEHLADSGMEVEAVLRADHLRRASNRVSVGNVITSMRLMAVIDWPAFFEATSLVEHVLANDPADAYASMEWGSRDRYRHVVEHLGRGHAECEIEVARQAIELAEQRKTSTEGANPDTTTIRQTHVGYYLMDQGLDTLTRSVGYQAPMAERIRDGIAAHPTRIYLGSIFLLTLALVVFMLALAERGVAWPAIVLLGLVSIIPASAIAISLIHWTITTYLPPRVPPRLEFKDRLSPEHRTMVVVPALISDLAGIQHLLEGLELRYLANQDPCLHFALLGDFADAPEPHMPEDDRLIDAATQGTDRLNTRYGSASRFYFFHRQRCWNSGECVWMGWERKRGKLLEFNRLLRGATDTNFTVQHGDLSILAQVQYVLTLDADTQLPPNSAKRLVGTIAHPLNRPVIDPVARRVVAGYGIIQPRTVINPPLQPESAFARIFGGETGLDPYSFASSDVYQDAFGAGSYVGKAIYEVDAALAVLDHRFPENWLLSHDLIEGAYARAGLASDIQLLEDYPSGYEAHILREHRWLRGDWQIIDWLGPRVPDEKRKSVPNPLPLIERWKILDNIRRSLLAPSTLLLVLLSALISPESAVTGTVFGMLALWLPLLVNVANNAREHPVGEPWRSYLWGVGETLGLDSIRALLLLTFLPTEAFTSLDAIVRVLGRRFITHRHLLQWTRFDAIQNSQEREQIHYWKRMWPASALALALLVLILARGQPWHVIALPVLALWLMSPSLAALISQPLPTCGKTLSAEAQRELRLSARRIWYFFETFVAEPDHWLPPDNYDVDADRIAHRTSPTNIGFALLAALVAVDFGYLSPGALVERWERMLESLDGLERYRGHFLNWYDTISLSPLHPRYVSTVDSGNLEACLMVVREACRELREGVTLDLDAAARGLEDTVRILKQILKQYENPADSSGPSRTVIKLRDALQEFDHVLPQMESGNIQPIMAAMTSFNGLVDQFEKELGTEPPRDLSAWSRALSRQLEGLEASLHLSTGSSQQQAWIDRVRTLESHVQALIDAMDFTFLYSPARQVFSVGYNLDDNQLDNSYYDLLESEARLTSIVAIARGQIPARHWFKLGRPLTRIGRDLALLSWGGTMFEYLMPPLFLRDHNYTLLHATEQTVVHAQIRYGNEFRVPWGISESGFYSVDASGNYQYRLFGVPELGLRRETQHNLVIAPYATFLALAVRPSAAYSNLRRLASEGMEGEYGYFEAIDYTPSRRPRDQPAGIVRSFMAHHQGMSLIALANVLNGDLIRQRFHADPAIAAVELLLQERIPQHAPLAEPYPEGEPIDQSEHRLLSSRRFTTPHTATPRIHLLSNGAYTVMITNAGAGYSAYGNWMITRWRQDLTRDATGTFCYIRDVATRQVWSTGFQPTTCRPEKNYEVLYTADRAVLRRRDEGIETQTEITVSPTHNAEIRRVTLANHTDRTRELELTSYAEIALDTVSADQAHPAFAKLFVESEFDSKHQALVFKRRQRSSKEQPLWAGHLLCVEGQARRVTGYETDRARFIGRGRTPANPQALDRPMTQSVGAVLDPIMSLRCAVRLAPAETVRVAFVTIAGDSREQVLTLFDQYSVPRNIEEQFDLAYAKSQVELIHLNITADDAHLFQRLAALIIFPDPGLRAKTDVALRNAKGQSGLWPYGISGDYPIVLVQVDDFDEIDLVRQALRAHEFLRLNSFRYDLVILDGHPTSYTGGLHAQLQALIDSSLSRPWIDRPGGVFLRKADQMPEEDRILLQTLARVILDGELGSLADQMDRAAHVGTVLTSRDTLAAAPWGRAERRARRSLDPLTRREADLPPAQSRPSPGPLFSNGIGGLTNDGREYVIALDANTTPAPWINVLANSAFGSIVSESGLGYTWSENSQTNRLTPWSNDPVSDPQGEAIYLRDEQTREIWSPTPLPIHGGRPYRVRHGAGYTVYEHTSHGLVQELNVFVPKDDPVKVMRLTLRNRSAQRRRLSVTGYAEWVLGVTREQGQLFVATDMDPAGDVLWARSVYNEEFTSRVAFATLTRTIHAFTADRSEFLGHTGSCGTPVGMLRANLSGITGFGLDPCAALRSNLELAPNEETSIVFLLGEAVDREHARLLLSKYREERAVQMALDQVTAHWDALLSTVQVKTPDPEMDVLLNRWLLYQTLACRIWARSAFYQSGGAFGFRDQLQDVLALAFAAPDLLRQHILNSASHQFVEGDVQHWWQPPGGQGLRTRFSDDLLWLPYVTSEYMLRIQDASILDEPIPFLQAPPLEPDQDEAYGTATVADQVGTLYEHCIRAIDHASKFGEHGLPLMGSGDWNDGMNRVGSGGKGESVWVGWFLFANLISFADLAKQRGDNERAVRYREQAKQLQSALEEHGWDGEWYRRAYFDDGTPLGSAQNSECKIDSIAQSWAVISRAAPPERAKRALQAVEQQLVRERDRLILLLAPPFDSQVSRRDQPAHDPGYIKGYVPGVRENGGQYTHAALWVVLAYTLLRDGDRAVDLFRLLNPLIHSRNRDEASRYVVEPYVVAADVYSQAAHLGRGGWTWYTGSAGWMYRIGIEDILGLKRRGDSLTIDPCIPAGWTEYRMMYRFGSATYQIMVTNPEGKNSGVMQVELDGVVSNGREIHLQDDGKTHHVRVVLGEESLLVSIRTKRD